MNPSSVPHQMRAIRGVGHAVAALILTAMVYALNVWPSWRSAGFLSDSARSAVSVLTASLILGAALNFVWVVYEPPWLRCLGDIATLALTLAAVGRFLSVFPFTCQLVSSTPRSG